MNKRTQKKSLQQRVELLERAAPTQFSPGGSLMYVPVGQQQGVLGATFYGNAMKNIPVGQTALFSPGVPLPPQPNVDPAGKPVQWRFPVAFNTYAVDRALGREDVPSFEVLRRLARMYDGIGLNERYWLDLVPRMTVDVRLKKRYVDRGVKIKDYQDEYAALMTFWEKPDGKHDLHSWLRMNLRETSQIDELYWYKNRTRGGKLLGLWVVAGDQMKPLLDDWGMLPDAPDYAYQQYPWGIPGMQYSTDMVLHYQETPAADTPYGESRTERIILRVNQALRKMKKDLAHFTEGNIPQSFMEVPEGQNWTPDLIDAFEQSWNALLAGSAQQQVRMKFLQPGMKYIPAEQYQLLTDMDLFLFKITCGCYGVPIEEFSFTDTSNRSTGESQEDVVFRRTIEPIALCYANLMTQVQATEFPEQHGEMFEAYIGGYEEKDDEQKTATTLSTYVSAGILGVTDAAKIANLPIDPKAPLVGRVIISPTAGPIFLDDVAQPAMREAQQQAALAGYKLAANPPAPAPAAKPGEEAPAAKGEDEGKAPGAAKPPANAAKGVVPENKATLERMAATLARIDDYLRLERAKGSEDEPGSQPAPEAAPGGVARDADDLGRGIGEDAARATENGAAPLAGAGADRAAKAVSAEYRRWRARAIEDVKAGRTQRGFTTTLIPEYLHTFISRELASCETPDDVRSVFERAKGDWTPPDTGAWQADDKDVQTVLADYQKRGVVGLKWMAGGTSTCDECTRNVGQTVKPGEPFATGAYTVTQHPHCECYVVEILADGSTQPGYGIGALVPGGPTNA